MLGAILINNNAQVLHSDPGHRFQSVSKYVFNGNSANR